MSTPAEQIPFGKWLRNQRRSLDLSRQALADQAGCAEITLRRIESGSLRPSRELAAILLSRVGVPEAEQPAWILFARGLSGFPAQQDDIPPGGRPSNLPGFLTSFIGREKEQAEVLQLLEGHRLVTLAGPGGVGKTRLAAFLGERLLADFPDGVYMVELASLGDPGLLPQSVALPFGITSRSSTPCEELLVNFLRKRQALIILDNCEHLLLACAELVERLLKSCPNLKILATSREPLQVPGEAVYRVPSMAIPPEPTISRKFRESEAIRLFEQRAQLARPDFALASENLFSLVEICRRLDGIPLAIELAAARVDIFTVEQIARKLGESFDLLTGGSRTLPRRQQTIRASIDWSWDLLSEEDRLLLCRLSIFSGGWTLAAAEKICAAGKLEAYAAAELLIQLAAKSLIVVIRTGPEGRYTMHELIRQYAREKLGEEEEKYARTQHLRYYLEFATKARRALSGPSQMDWVAQLNAEQDNLRSALDFAARTDLKAGLSIIGSLEDDMDLREGLRWASEFLEKPESHAHPHARAQALLAHSGYLWYFQQFEAARAACEESLRLFQACGDPLGEFGALMALGSAYQFLEGMDRKNQYHERALALARGLGDLARQATALDVLGWDRRDPQRSNAYWDEAIALYRKLGSWRYLAFLLGVYGDNLVSSGQVEAAQGLLDESLALARRMNSKRGMEFVLIARHRKALLAGNLVKARASLEEWIELAQELGNRMGYLWGRARLGYVALLEGNRLEASEILSETARQFHTDGNKAGLAFTLEKLASLFTQTGRYENAIRLIAWADRTRQEMGEVRPALEQTDVDRDLEMCRSRLGEQAFAEAMAAGRLMTFDEAFAVAVENSHV